MWNVSKTYPSFTWEDGTISCGQKMTSDTGIEGERGRRGSRGKNLRGKKE
jgi:hypothetical protein